MTNTETSDVARQVPSEALSEPVLRIHPHSTVLYWWPVWLLGLFCAATTYFFGKPVEIGGHKAVLVYPDAWLGVLYLSVFCFVFGATHLKTSGAWAVVVILCFVLGLVAVQQLYGWDKIRVHLGFLLIYMNLAFYLFSSLFFFAIWFISVQLVSRSTYWNITHGRVTAHRFGNTDHSLDTHGMEIKRLPYDFFVHWFLGLGAGDIELKIRTEKFLIENVINARKRVREANAIITRKQR